MGPIEVLWATVVLFFVMITLVRGYTRELGITVLLLLALFVQVYFRERIEVVLCNRVFPTFNLRVVTIEQPNGPPQAIVLECPFTPPPDMLEKLRTGDEVWKQIFTRGELMNLLLVALFVGMLLVLLFIGYEGRTLAFPGAPAKGVEGFLLNVFIGLVNGWLFAGSVWYYMDKYHYPFMVRFELLKPEWTKTAQTLMEYFPPKLFEPRPEILAAFAAVLIFLSIRR